MGALTFAIAGCVLAVYAALWWFVVRKQRWQPYDPTWLVDLLGQQHPDEVELAASAQHCTRARVGRCYVYFVSSDRANQSRAEWQFSHNLLLESAEHGDIVVDVLQGNRLGGIEFLSRMLERRT